MNFGDKLYNLRVKADYSQEALAEKLGVSRQAVSKWELGTTLPDMEKLLAISEFFNVSADYLIKNTEEQENRANMDRVVLRFLGLSQDMESVSKDLVDIMADGVIDEDERKRMDEIMASLDDISEIIEEIKRKIGS